jgi:hypothetical protein
MIYTAPCVMLLMRADKLHGHVGWVWALENGECFGPCDGIEPIGKCHLGPEKLAISRAQPPPTCPRNVSARMATDQPDTTSTVRTSTSYRSTALYVDE